MISMELSLKNPGCVEGTIPSEFQCESHKNRITRRSTMSQLLAISIDRSLRKASLQAANMYFPAVVWKALRTKMRNSQRRIRLRVACVNNTCVTNRPHFRLAFSAHLANFPICVEFVFLKQLFYLNNLCLCLTLEIFYYNISRNF